MTCLHLSHLFWSKEGLTLFYWLILYSDFFFFKAQFAYEGCGQFYIPISSALSILSSNFPPKSIFLIVTTPGWIFTKRKKEKCWDFKFLVTEFSFQSQNHRRISSCAFIISKDIETCDSNVKIIVFTQVNFYSTNMFHLALLKSFFLYLC